MIQAVEVRNISQNKDIYLLLFSKQENFRLAKIEFVSRLRLKVEISVCRFGRLLNIMGQGENAI